MGGAFDKGQRMALSLHTGNILVECYGGNLPQWSEIGTEIRKRLCNLIADRLRDKDCGDVVDLVDDNLQDIYYAIQRRLKSLREKKNVTRKKVYTDVQ